MESVIEEENVRHPHHTTLASNEHAGMLRIAGCGRSTRAVASVPFTEYLQGNAGLLISTINHYATPE